MSTSPELSPLVPTNGWLPVKLNQSLRSPWERERAVLDLSRIGTISLTVISMSPDTTNWQSWYEIHKAAKKLAEPPFVNKTTAKNYLNGTIQTAGVVESRDRREFSLTQFGILARPVLVFLWQKYLELGLDPNDILGTQATTKRDDKGKIVATPASVRERIFATAYVRGEVKQARLAELTGLSSFSTSTFNHIDRLEIAGFLTQDEVDINSGKHQMKYQISKKGLELDHWAKKSKYAGVKPHLDIVRETILKHIGQEWFFIDNLIDMVGIVLKETDTINCLGLAVRNGLIEKQGRESGDLSRIKLTDLGRDVMEKIFWPLRAWSYDPFCIDEINQLSKTLDRDPDLFKDLTIKIQEKSISNSKHSPQKEGLQHKLDPVLSVLDETGEGLIASEIETRTGFSRQTTRRVLSELVKTRLVIDIGKKSGQKRSRYIKISN